MRPPFRDRAEAGRVLAGRLGAYAGRPDVLVLALPRGGVPVAAEVAAALGAPLDVLVVRKLGVPGQEELAMGAIAGGGTIVVNERVIRQTGLPPYVLHQVARRERRELERRERAYRRRPMPQVEGRTVLLVDDGLATGSTMRAAVLALREGIPPGSRPARIVVAVPAASRRTCEELQDEADEVVCAATPDPFLAVGRAYGRFEQISDDQVRALLDLPLPAPDGPADG
ncbi:MAG TPA: phosphoribosyltransferase family protein [Actinomycetes bacterium]|nr:phosphoribosyltransferase family protein [Actinomycetes bacterium]